MQIPNVSEIKSLLDWKSKPVLLAGKGPSFSARPLGLCERFHVVGINQAASHQHCELAVMNDIEPWLGTQPINAEMALALPSWPHWHQRPGGYDIQQWTALETSLESLCERGRLFAFDMQLLGQRKYPDESPILAVYSSTESALQILAMAGVRRVHTVGIDGGSALAPEFASQQAADTYDGQFQRFREIQAALGLTIERLNESIDTSSPESLLEACESRSQLPEALMRLGLDGKWVELGVAEGVYSGHLLHRGRPKTLYSVDRWGGDRGHDEAQYIRALRRLEPYKSSSQVIRSSFDDAARLFESESLDFAYIDGYAHTGQEAGATLEQWWPKIRPGAIMAGHDYHADWRPTMQAVDEFASRHSLKLHLTKESRWPSWIVRKPTG